MPESTEYTRLGDDANTSWYNRLNYGLTRLEKGLIIVGITFGLVIFALAVALAKCDEKVHPTPSPNSTTIEPNVTVSTTPNSPTPTVKPDSSSTSTTTTTTQSPPPSTTTTTQSPPPSTTTTQSPPPSSTTTTTTTKKSNGIDISSTVSIVSPNSEKTAEDTSITEKLESTSKISNEEVPSTQQSIVEMLSQSVVAQLKPKSPFR